MVISFESGDTALFCEVGDIAICPNADNALQYVGEWDISDL